MTQNPYHGPADPYRGPGDQGPGWEQSQAGGHGGRGPDSGGYGSGGFPGQGPGPVPVGQTPYPGAYGNPGWPDDRQAPPNNNMVWAIVTTVFCCLPLGIASIVKANQVNSKLAQGDRAGAVKAANDAKNFAIAAAVLGVVFGVIYVFVIGVDDL